MNMNHYQLKDIVYLLSRNASLRKLLCTVRSAYCEHHSLVQTCFHWVYITSSSRIMNSQNMNKEFLYYEQHINEFLYYEQ